MKLKGLKEKSVQDDQVLEGERILILFRLFLLGVFGQRLGTHRQNNTSPKGTNMDINSLGGFFIYCQSPRNWMCVCVCECVCVCVCVCCKCTPPELQKV